MKDDDALMIVLSFVLGYTASGMKNIYDTGSVEGFTEKEAGIWWEKYKGEILIIGLVICWCAIWYVDGLRRDKHYSGFWRGFDD